MKIISALTLTAAFAFGLPLAGSSATFTVSPMHQILSLNGTTVTLEIRQTGSDDVHISATFQSDTGAAECVSLYSDFRYDLRDSTGKLVPINQQALQRPPMGGTLNHVVANGRPLRCEDRGVRQTTQWSLFSSLYPGLSPGAYTLSVTFMPRGGLQKVEFTPIRIVIDPS